MAGQERIDRWWRQAAAKERRALAEVRELTDGYDA
jgi:hypothetical protein